MDSQSSALDDELKSFQENQEDYLESLRESIKETDRIIEETYINVMSNADVVLETLTTTTQTKGVTIKTNLLDPWESASNTANTFKNNASGYLQSLINDETGIINFNATAKPLLKDVFGAGSTAAFNFQTDAQGYLQGLMDWTRDTNWTSGMSQYLDPPWKSEALLSFSQTAESQLGAALTSAQGKLPDMTYNLSQPWKDAKAAVEDWGKKVNEEIWNAKVNAEGYYQKINELAANNTPDYGGDYTKPSDSGTGGTGGGGGTTFKPASGGTTTPTIKDQNVAKLQKILKYVFGYNLGTYGPNGDGVDGDYGSEGSKTWQAVEKLQNKLKNDPGLLHSYARIKMVANGKYDTNTAQALKDYFAKYPTEKNKLTKLGFSYQFLPTAKYAKGTLGTTKDQWAIDSEPWLGDELVLIPNEAGNLSFMRKGTGVVPADLTKRIFELAQMPNSELIGQNIVKAVVPNISANTNAISVNFEALVKADTITNDVLPEVERLVSKQLSDFTRKLNYSIKKFQ